MAGSLGGDHPHVDPARRRDLPVVDREAVAEEEHVAGREAVANALLPHLPVELVGDKHHHQIATAGGLDNRQHLEAMLARLRRRGRVRAQADDDLDARVLQVQGVGVALGAVADDRDGLSLQQREVGVVVVEHLKRAGYPTHAVAAATSVRAGISSVPPARM